LIIKLTNSKSEIKFIDYKDIYANGYEDMVRRVPDIEKIRNFIRWIPKIGLDEIVSDVIESKVKDT
jgi:UDP-glucose 4-epimerase